MVGGVAVLLYGGGLGYLYVNQESLLFYRGRKPYPAHLEGGSRVSFRSASGRQGEALWFPPTSGAPVVVHFHGNAESLPEVVPLANWYRRRGIGFWAIEYPGFEAGATTEPSESAMYEMAEAGIGHLTRNLGVPPERQVLDGVSLGTAVALEMASRGHGSKVVLWAPFTSIRDVAAAQYPFVPMRLLLRHPFDSLACASKVVRPVLIIHGARDPMFPIEMPRQLERALPSAKLRLVEGDHFILDPERRPDLLEEALSFIAGPGVPTPGATDVLVRPVAP